MKPVAYVVMQPAVHICRPVKAYARWMDRIPDVYSKAIPDGGSKPGMTVYRDPHCIAILKLRRCLMPLAREARKPMFSLKPADGALGSHSKIRCSLLQRFPKARH